MLEKDNLDNKYRTEKKKILRNSVVSALASIVLICGGVRYQVANQLERPKIAREYLEIGFDLSELKNVRSNINYLSMDQLERPSSELLSGEFDKYSSLSQRYDSPKRELLSKIEVMTSKGKARMEEIRSDPKFIDYVSRSEEIFNKSFLAVILGSAVMSVSSVYFGIANKKLEQKIREENNS